MFPLANFLSDRSYTMISANILLVDDDPQKLRPGLPTILLTGITGHGNEELGGEAVKVGAYAFIHKPIDRDYFLAWLKRTRHTWQLGKQAESQRQALEVHAHQLEQTVELRTPELARPHDNKVRLRSVSVPSTFSATRANDGWLSRPSGRTIFTIHPEDHEWSINSCLRMTAKQTGHDFEYRMIAADGRIVWLRDLVTAVLEAGTPVKLIGVMADVSERHKMVETLQTGQ
ncbi:MAG: hypothetical protein C4293_04785, partial [Nitrospiraceae bacterium]